jgi:hypothetical protein
VTPTEIAMLEKDFKNSALIKQFLKDDVKSMASKLGLAYQQQETMILKVNSLEQEAKASGLDNLELISLFDKLTAAVSNMKREIDMMQKDFSNRAQILERKVQDLKRVNETKTRSVEVISQEGQMISDNINHMKKFESNRELSLIHKIADAEKKKIAILTKDSKILIDESFNLGSNEPGTKTVGVGISSKSIQTPDSLRMLGNFAYD